MSQLGIIVALPAEAKSLGAERGRIGESFRVNGGSVIISGMGPGRAKAAAERLIKRGAGALVSWGMAGGLSPMPRPGDLMIPERVIGDNATWSVDAGWHQHVIRELATRVPVTGGALWSSPSPVTTVEEKRRLARRKLAAVDMESGAIAAVAARAGRPFMAVKVIVDPAERALPKALLGMLDDEGQVRLGGVPGVVLGGVPAWRAMRFLRRDFAAALDTLSTVFDALPAVAGYTVPAYG